MDDAQFSLRTQLILVILLAAILSVGLVFYYGQQDEDQHTGYAFGKAAVIASQIASTQQQIITNTELFLKKLAQSAAVQDPADPQCGRYLATLLGSSPVFVNIGVPRADGELLCNALPLKKRVNVMDRDYFQRSLRQRVFAIGDFQQDRAAGVTSVNFSYPVIAPATDTVVGVAVAVVSLRWWSERLQEFKLPPDSVAFIVDSNQTLVANYPHLKQDLGQPSTIYGVQELPVAIAGPLTERVVGGDGVARAYAHSVLYQSPDRGRVTVSVGIPLDHADSEIKQWLRYLLVLLLGVITLFAALTLFKIRGALRRSG